MRILSFLISNLKIVKVFLPKEKNTLKVYHLYHLKLKNKKIRDKILNKLISKKLMQRYIILPLCIYSQLQKFMGKKEIFQFSEKLSDTSLSLPVHEFVLKKDLYNISRIILSEIEK